MICGNWATEVRAFDARGHTLHVNIDECRKSTVWMIRPFASESIHFAGNSPTICYSATVFSNVHFALDTLHLELMTHTNQTCVDEWQMTSKWKTLAPNFRRSALAVGLIIACQIVCVTSVPMILIRSTKCGLAKMVSQIMNRLQSYSIFIFNIMQRDHVVGDARYVEYFKCSMLNRYAN